MRTQTRHSTPVRRGFTLLELLIAIVIISVLIGLLLPVISSLFGTAGNAEVLAEFNSLETNIAQFKSEFGAIPYSSITLYETGSEWATDTTGSKTRIRKLWQKFDFGDFDFDNDGTVEAAPDGVHTLTSSEALIFFLGGMESTPGSKILTGFSKNPFTPFIRTGENRTGPFFNFDASRLVDRDSDGFYEYAGLSTSDDNSADSVVFASSNNGQGYDDALGAVNHYRKSDGSTPWREDSFQLIDPGNDGSLGFDPTITAAPALTWSEDARPTGAQADNLANFTSSVLGN